MKDRPMDASSRAVLIGLRGSGKTTVGRELGRLLACGHVDTDEVIVARSGMTIRAIFQTHGEPHFRALEREVIAELARNPPRVISVGGGAILDPVNVQALRSIGRIVWLTAPPSVLWDRIEKDPRSASDRPPLTTCGGRAGMAQLLIKREPLYRAAAELIIETNNKAADRVAQEIIECWRLK